MDEDNWFSSPFFFFSVDVDILKPDTGYLSVIERPSTISVSPSTKGSPTASSSRQAYSPREGTESPAMQVYSEPLSEGEEDDEEGLPAPDEGKRTGLSGADLELAISYREQMLKMRKEEEDEENRKLKKAGKEKDTNGVHQETGTGGLVNPEAAEHADISKRHKHSREKSTISKKALSIDPLALSSAFDETLKTKLEGEEMRRRFIKGRSAASSQVHTPRSVRSRSRARAYGQRNDQVGDGEDIDRPADEAEEEAALGGPAKRNGDDRIVERSWRAPEGKRISVPVRIEPKVYFAAERTFLVNLSPFTDFMFRPYLFLSQYPFQLFRNGSITRYSSARLLPLS